MTNIGNFAKIIETTLHALGHGEDFIITVDNDVMIHNKRKNESATFATALEFEMNQRDPDALAGLIDSRLRMIGIHRRKQSESEAHA